MNGVVLDSSALLALLLEEPGARRVEEALNGAIMSSVNLAEVVGYYAKLDVAEIDIRNLLRSLPVILKPFDVDLAYDAGLMRPMGEKAGLSLGDRACLALARKLGARVLTSDRAWKKVLADCGVTVEFIR